MKTLIVCTILLNLYSIIVATVTRTEPILFSFIICQIINFYSYRNNSLFRKICNYSFAYFSFWGLTAYLLYYLYCGNTFAPYHDDSFYYLNIINILNEGIDDDATLYEYFIALCSLPLKFIFGKIIHVQLLPINWLLGAFVVSESIKFAQKVVPTFNLKAIKIGVMLILLNVSFLDGVVHLYRDILMLYLFIKSINCIYSNNFPKAIFLSLLTGFIRGANSILLFLYMMLRKVFSPSFMRKKKILYISFGVGMLLLISFNQLFDYSSLRSFSSNNEDNSVTIADRIENFKNSEGTGGVLTLLRSSNPFLNVVAIPIYAISPLKVRSFIIHENYLIRNSKSRYIIRPRLEAIWELLGISFYAFYIFPLFVGFYYWCKELNFENLIILMFFITILVSVTFISMQTRHKMAFIIFYPIIYNYYIINKFKIKKSYKTILTSLFVTLILLYNL